MIKKTKLIIIISYLCMNSFSQDNDMKDLLKTDIKLLNDNIFKKIEQLPCIANKKVRIFHIFSMEYKGEMKKEEFANLNFLKKLTPYYFTQKTFLKERKYLQTSVFLIDTSDNLIARSQSEHVYSICKYSITYALEDIELLKTINEKRIDFVFNIGLTPSNIFFGVKGEEVYIFEETKTKLHVYSVEEFLNCCWEKFILTHNYFPN